MGEYDGTLLVVKNSYRQGLVRQMRPKADVIRFGESTMGRRQCAVVFLDPVTLEACEGAMVQFEKAIDWVESSVMTRVRPGGVMVIPTATGGTLVWAAGQLDRVDVFGWDPGPPRLIGATMHTNDNQQ